MSSSTPTRTGARRTRRSKVAERRRRLALFATGLALLLAYTAFATTRHPLSGTAHPLNHARIHSPSIRWPPQGEAALVLGNGRPAASRTSSRFRSPAWRR